MFPSVVEGSPQHKTHLKQLQNHPRMQLDDEALDVVLATHGLDPRPLRLNDIEGFIETRHCLLGLYLRSSPGMR